MEIIFITLALGISLAALMPHCYGASWDARVDRWSISRESTTMAMAYVDGYSGRITTVDVTPDGRSIEGYHSRYVSIDVNDMRLDERTSALSGNIGSEGKTIFISEAENDVEMNMQKPSGTLIYTFAYSEVWPSLISNQRSTAYTGSGMNDMETIENNGDLVERRILYSPELLKESASRTYLNRTNITVTAVDKTLGGFRGVQFNPTKYLTYSVRGQSAGIAQTTYRQISPDKRSVLAEGVERIVGRNDVRLQMSMSTTYVDSNPGEDWLGFCRDVGGVTSLPEVPSQDGIFGT